MPFSVWDAYTNTETVNRAVETVLEQENPIGAQIMPLVPVRDRKLRRGIIEVEAFGKGQFKARNATPPLFVPRIDFTDEFIELAFLEEMTYIEEDEWHDLTGDNEYSRIRAGVAILARARMLQIRNERLTEWMRWQALQDNLIITMGDVSGQNYKLTYGLPADQNITVSPLWTSRTTSTPVQDIRTVQRLLSNRTGYFGLNIYMSSITYENLQFSKSIADLLKPNSSGSDFFIPTRDQIMSLFFEGTNLTITDAGFRDTSAGTARGASALTKWIPDGKVLITTPNVVGGERIGDVADGRVAVYNRATNDLEWRQGAQSETLLDDKKHTYFWRQASARIPRVYLPANVAWLTVA
jgi:hypothetical protein